MSSHEPTTLHEPAPPARARWRVRLVWVACALALMSAVGSYLLRTQWVLGPMIAERARVEARARGVDLYIGSMRPSGLWGVRFDRTRARIQRGPYQLDTRVAWVEVSLDVIASIEAGAPIPSQIRLHHAAVILDRGAAPSEAGAHAPSTGASAGALAHLRELRVVGDHVTIELRAGDLRTTRPVTFERLEATLPLGEALPLPTSLRGWGQLPDGASFALSTEERDGEPGRQITLSPDRPTAIHDWFRGQLPFSLTTERVIMCSGCAQDAVEFGDTTLSLPSLGEGLIIATQGARLTWDDRIAQLDVSEVGVAPLVAGSSAPIELESARFFYNSARGTHSGELSVIEGDQGRLTATWLWSGPGGLVDGSIEATSFSLRPLLRLMGTSHVLHDGQVSGRLALTLDREAGWAIARTNARIKRWRATLPRLATEPLSLERASVHGELILDLAGRAASLPNLVVSLGDLEPITISAQLIDAGADSLSFEGAIRGERLSGSRMLDALPDAMANAIRGAEVTGALDLDVHVSGHTAYPKSFRLGVETGGEVQVVRDAPQSDIARLASIERPADLASDEGLRWPAQPGDWVDLAALPSHVSATVLAAEDAQFRRHAGFAWGGIERAMQHNIEVGAMERGGSTLTQQLVKSLYLSRDRTVSRKVQEAYLTWRIEQAMSKDRILELYLNVVHWGVEVYGIEHAARHYFDRSAGSLAIPHVALLGAILPNPVRFGGQILAGHLPSSRLTKFEHIMSNLRFLGHISSETYTTWMRRARRGEIGGLHLAHCRDDDTAPEDTPPCPAIEP